MRFEIGRKHGINIYYTGYTLAAISKDDALQQYLKLSGSENNNDIRINQIEE